MAHAEKNMAAYDNRKHAGTVNKANSLAGLSEAAPGVPSGPASRP